MAIINERWTLFTESNKFSNQGINDLHKFLVGIVMDEALTIINVIDVIQKSPWKSIFCWFRMPTD